MWIALLCNTLAVPAWPVAAAAWRDLCSYFIRNIICCAPGSQQAAWSGATARVQDTTVATRASNEGSRRLRVLQSWRRFVWSFTQQPHWCFSLYALYMLYCASATFLENAETSLNGFTSSGHQQNLQGLRHCATVKSQSSVLHPLVRIHSCSNCSSSTYSAALMLQSMK